VRLRHSQLQFDAVSVLDQPSEFLELLIRKFGVAVAAAMQLSYELLL
jgi:hypothetical protein